MKMCVCKAFSLRLPRVANTAERSYHKAKLEPCAWVYITSCDRKKFEPVPIYEVNITVTFNFSLKKSEFLVKWKQLVTLYSILVFKKLIDFCSKNSLKKIKPGNRTSLHFFQNPNPTIQFSVAEKRSAVLPPHKVLRKLPKVRNIFQDQFRLPEDNKTESSSKTLESSDPCPNYECNLFK